jgi:transcriptional regulator with PAS, ATPase and Fis domain
VTVLIGGETGTGKTFLARLIHDSSARADERFVVVPCGALAGGLVESELFGHVKGAFTGADADREGRFAAAAAGTLLLDEIDALPLEQQAKLLRVIETGDYEPVGSNTTRRSQTRVIAATNIILEDAVDEGRFREDLFYRLNVLHIELPALAERAGDILPFARAMVAKYAERFDKPIYRLTEEVALALESFSWPGNVRQLENTMQQAVLACPGPELTVAHLPPALRPGPRLAAKPAGPLVRQREQSERVAIQRALTEAGDCRAKAARALGVSRVTLYKKLKKYGLTTTTTPQPA